MLCMTYLDMDVTVVVCLLL